MKKKTNNKMHTPKNPNSSAITENIKSVSVSGKKSKFQFVVDFFFDDITIRLAKQKLDNIKIFKQNKSILIHFCYVM